MSNLTISVDEQLIKQARIRAIEQGTSVSAKVREFLTFIAAARSSTANSDGAAWCRDDAYDRVYPSAADTGAAHP